MERIGQTLHQTPSAGAAPLPRGFIQRKCACGGTPGLAGECAECRRRRLRQVTKSETISVSQPLVNDVLRTSGQPLDGDTRAFMEPRFGHDFSRVRIHSDGKAAESARAVQARAYTMGPHVVFGAGQYSPGTAAGRRLLAHELTHVVQQRDASELVPSADFYVSQPDDPYEQEAEHVARSIAQGEPADAARMGAFSRPIRPVQRAMIQRVANWVAGSVHETNNAAIQIIKGAEAGSTTPVLNTTILNTSADARAALKKPALSYAQVAGGGMEAWVFNVQDNIGSFDETVLSPGPWTTPVQRTTARTLVRQPQCAGSGWSQFTVNGIPSETDVAAANREHEDQHARDHQLAFQTIVIWDREMTRLKNSGQRFAGADMAACQANLFAAVGGTPIQVADDFFNTAIMLAQQFHSTPSGSNLKPPSNRQANADCSTSSMDLTY
ncbi:MAG: DUF4157 domain-containing protein [Anaerolineae bacterium]|nr:DUF4157 domain-containing protein [Anaerolineae bacterium]